MRMAPPSSETPTHGRPRGPGGTALGTAIAGAVAIAGAATWPGTGYAQGLDPDAPPTTPADPASGATPARTVLLLVDAPARASLEGALQLELADRDLAVLGLDAPAGETPLARAAEAQRAARFAGAEAALWVESAPSSQGSGATLRAVTPDDTEASRFAPLPAPLGDVDPRTFSVVGGSLVHELVSPPEEPIRVRVEVSVDAPGREIEVTTVMPGRGETTTGGETTPAPGAAADETVPSPEPNVPPPPADAPAPVVVVPAGAAPGSTADAGLDGSGGEDGHPEVRFGADLVPFVGTSGRHRAREIRDWSLNLVGGANYGVRRGELAAGFNLNRGFVHGFQAAGGANLNLGELDGVQVAAGINLAGGEAEGAQIAAGANYAGGPMRGGQVAAGGNVAAAGIGGGQVAAGGNLAFGPVRGAQVAAGFNLATEGISGVQAASVNVATGEVDGVQLGLVNVAEDADFALGLVNVFYGGRLHVELSGDESGFVEARLKNGGDHFHYLYTLGGRGRTDAGAKLSFGMGLGGHVPVSDALFVDFELLARGLAGDHADDTDGVVVRSDTSQDGVRWLHTVRVAVGFSLAPKLALIGGLTYNVFVDPGDTGDDGTDYGLFGNHHLGGGVRGWPGFTLGVQFL